MVSDSWAASGVTPVSAQVALARLRDGNHRFASGSTIQKTPFDQTRHSGPIADQEPFAIVLGCSDSRVPAEIVFDQGLGDLFVVRVAGNIAFASQIGSVELAAERFGARLVVVLGHSDCGAIAAALEQVEHPSHSRSPSLDKIIAYLQPTARAILALNSQPKRDDLMRLAVRANILTAMGHLKLGSNILTQLIENDGLIIVGAEYSLRTGKVRFLEDLQDSRECPLRIVVDNERKESIS